MPLLKMLAAALAFAALQGCVSAQEAAQEERYGVLHGEWDGGYWQGPQSVHFMMFVSQAGGAASFTGRIDEGERTAIVVNGSISESGLVRFTKIYDGAGPGNWTHAVEYEGQLSTNGRAVRGRWRIGETSDWFHLHKTPIDFLRMNDP